MQGSIKGKTQWLYADPKQKRDLLSRARAKANELYTLLLDVEAKEGVLRMGSASYGVVPDANAVARPASSSSSSAFVDPSIAALLHCVGTTDNLHKLFLSSQRWMFTVDGIYDRLLKNKDAFAEISKDHKRWVSAAVFPSQQGFGDYLCDFHTRVSVLMDQSVNPTAMQVPSPWLYVEAEKSDSEKAAAITQGTDNEYSIDRINTSKDGSGLRAALPEDSMLTRRLSNSQQVDFMQNLPYRMCATDDAGETTLGKYARKRRGARRRGTSEQRDTNALSQRIEGLPLTKDGRVTTASCQVLLDASFMSPYERLHTLCVTNAFVLHSLYFDGRAVTVKTNAADVATFLETVYGEFLDEHFLAVELVEGVPPLFSPSATALPSDTEAMAAARAQWLEGSMPLAAASVWAVPDGNSARAEAPWPASVCESLLLKAIATDCRSIIVPGRWKGVDALKRSADELASRLEKARGSSSCSSTSPSSSSSSCATVPSLYVSDQPIADLLEDTARVPYLTLLTPDGKLGQRVARGASLVASGASARTSADLDDAVKVVGVNCIAVDTPLFFPSASCPVVGSGWKSTTANEPTATIGNAFRFQSVGRTVVERSWEGGGGGVTVSNSESKAIQSLTALPMRAVNKVMASTYDAASTPLTVTDPPSATHLVSERLCGTLANGLDFGSNLGLLSAKLFRF